MRGIFKVFAYLFLVYLALSVVINLMKVNRHASSCKDTMEVINNADDRNHQRDWSLVDQSAYFCTNYQTLGEDYIKSAEKRGTMPSRLGKFDYLWSRVYKVLVEDSQDEIAFVADSLSELATQDGLDQMQLAELVVTFIQDIPYSWVIPGDCEKFDSGGKPCLGNVPYGIITPYEFLHTQYGDCDTRAVLIYAILERLGFDPMIVVSDEYAHAMLALNVPASGDYLELKGKKYYFWETTATGWPVGMLPPNTNNKAYWKITLAHEL